MFTGIVEELGELRTIVPANGIVTLTVHAPVTSGGIGVSGDVGSPDTELGDSIAVNGVCLTVVQNKDDELSFEVVPETLERTTLGQLKPGDQLNLERAATLSTRLGGHLVSGHIDGLGAIVSRRPRTTNGADEIDTVSFNVPSELARYVVTKGSITVDGVSLTVAAVEGDTVTVALIPTTLRETTLGARPVGSQVNLEVDLIAKHVEKLLQSGGAK